MRPTLVLVLLAHFMLAQPAAGQPPSGSAGDTRQELFVSSGFVESKRISSGEAFPIWITFENRSNGEIRNLRFVDFRKAGLVQVGQCWTPFKPVDPQRPKFPSCILDSALPTQPSNLPARLAPGQAITLTADLKRGDRSGEFMVTGVYTWIGTDNREHRAIIPIGPIEVTKNWENWRARMSEDLPVILKDIVFPALKDLGWPLAAFFLGLFIRLGEERRASIQQTWNQMLPEIHKDTIKYYLPIDGAASQLISSLDNRSHRDPDEPFYFLALLFRRMRVTLQENGGFYFKDRLGEDIIVEAWDRIFREFTESFPDNTGISKKEILVDSIVEKETLSEYKKKLSVTGWYALPDSGRVALVEIQKKFEEWVKTDDFRSLVLPLLRAFVTAIGYEINRPYNSWYTVPPFFDAKSLQQQEKELKEWLKEASQKATNELAEGRIKSIEYFYKELRRYRKQNKMRPIGTKRLFRLWYRLRSQLW